MRRKVKLWELFSATKKIKEKNPQTPTKPTKKELVRFFLLLPYSRSLLGFHTTDHTLSEILNSLHYFFWRINLDWPRDKNQNAQWIPTLNSSLLLWTQHKKRKKESHTSCSIYTAFTQYELEEYVKGQATFVQNLNLFQRN